MAWTSTKVRAAADSVDPWVLTPEERYQVHQYGYAHWIRLPLGVQLRSTPVVWVATGVYVGVFSLLFVLSAAAASAGDRELSVNAMLLVSLWMVVSLPFYLWLTITESTKLRLRMLDDYLRSIGYPQRLALARAAPPPPVAWHPSAQVQPPPPYRGP